MVVDGSRVRSVRTADGKELFAKSFISAVPWYVARTLLPVHNINFNQFHPSPIISIYIWFDREITDLMFAALPEMRVQWMFNRTKLLQKENSIDRGSEKQCISLVISGAKEYVELDEKQLVNIAIEDMQSALPQVRDAKIINSLVIKERRATFLPSPGLEAFRPDTKTEFENLFLAGDWTATGYPATIEGAVISGRKAADSIKNTIL
jgi:zeta-carotene desaturase